MFRNHRERAVAEGRAASITVNFRTRGEVLDAIDLAFERTFGEDFEPLREAPGARGTAPEPRPWRCSRCTGTRRPGRRCCRRGARVRYGGRPAWRALEARLLAKRIDELTRTDGADWGEVVVLLRATTSMSVYERALEERGVPTHVVGGRGYWSQQQVLDLRHWLAALANPLDELALIRCWARRSWGSGSTRWRSARVHGASARIRSGRCGKLWSRAGDWLAEVLPRRTGGGWGRSSTRFDAERQAARAWPSRR